MEWQPIETAPKDGREFLVMTYMYGMVVIHFDVFENGFSCGFGDDSFFQSLKLTHWMQLPRPPKNNTLEP